MQNKLSKILIGLVFLLAIVTSMQGCKQYTPEEQKYIAGIEEARKKKDVEMMDDPNSPFRVDSNAHYAPLKYFAVDPTFVFKSKLTYFANTDTVITYGTKGEERKVIKIGYLTFQKDAKSFKVNVYQGTSRSGATYHSIWFTDKTTGAESYGVGRYIDFELMSDRDFVYTLDFNTCYSPYCSYSAKYSCAIPTKEDYLDLAITAGEKKFHD